MKTKTSKVFPVESFKTFGHVDETTPKINPHSSPRHLLVVLKEDGLVLVLTPRQGTFVLLYDVEGRTFQLGTYIPNFRFLW